jgi:hypothetical protein
LVEAAVKALPAPKSGRDGKDATLDEAKLKEWLRKFAADFLRRNKSLFRGERGLSGQILRETTTSSSSSSSGEVPVGGVVMWSGTIAAAAALLPTWALCDGTANAPGPDLRDKFIVGATSDDAGVAKTNIRGSLEQSGTATGHSHSAHANLTHSGLTIADHTGLTHGVTIANHPDLTHAALSHAAQTFTHADHAIASVTHSHAGITHADISLASFSGTHASATGSVPSQSHTHASSAAGQASLTLSISSQGTARTIMTGSSVTIPSFTGSDASMTFTVASGTHTHPASTLTIVSHPTFSGTHPATTLTHADHSFPSLSHQAIGTHVGTDYGVHTITPPAAHGTAGTLTHSFGGPSDHTISAHDIASIVPSFFALAFIQRMA